MRLLPIWLFSWVIVIGASVGVLYHAITGRVQETLFAAGMVGLVLYAARRVFFRNTNGVTSCNMIFSL